MLSHIAYGALFVSLLAFLYMFCAAKWILAQEKGTVQMRTIATRIAQGATAFLRTEYSYMAGLVGVTSILFGLLDKSDHTTGILRIINYLVGAGLSAVAGVIGMRVATATNVRTAQAARTTLSKAFSIAFVGGTIMGIGVVASALAGLSLLLLGSLYCFWGTTSISSMQQAHMLLEVLTGFALGAETIALFARVAGGIYTKAADIGADIVGKIEKGIPEDDPRNPATIADNVGDNVGDVAGMGADLFGSYVATTLAAMVLGIEITTEKGFVTWIPMMLPIALGALGLLVSLALSLWIRLPNEKSSVQGTFDVGNLVAIIAMGIGSYGLIYYMVPQKLIVDTTSFTSQALAGAVLIGLLVGLVVSWITTYFTSMGYWPVRFIVQQSFTGPATNLIAGLSIGMFSTAIPLLTFALAIYATYLLAGFYGVAMAAVGMMSTTAIQLAIDGFGPIADNAGGIAEMAHLSPDVRRRTDQLDAVGNTTAAAGKGFAIASAALTALGLLAAFARKAQLDHINLFQADVLAGCFVGAMVPFLFSGLIISAVGKAAMAMVQEVRRQFRVKPALLQGKDTPDYDRCIAIATKAALQQMLWPGLLVLATPVALGLCCGATVLGAFLVSLVVIGTAMALFQCNAGGAWDNAKKTFEKGGTVAGHTIAKGTKSHQAAVVGDTVGDPLKDTSGPSMNILIKLSIVVALMVVPYLGT